MTAQPKVKVYGWNLDGRRRAIVATTSYRAAAEAATEAGWHTSPAAIAKYGCPTGNPEEIRQAMSEVGTVFVRGHNDYHSSWSKLEDA